MARSSSFAAASSAAVLIAAVLLVLHPGAARANTCNKKAVFTQPGDFSKVTIPSGCTRMMVAANKFTKDHMGDAGAIAIASVLKSSGGDGAGGNAVVEVLDLRTNRIGDAGATALADALKTNIHVKELWLGDNLITDEGAGAFLAMLKVNTAIIRLDVHGNRKLSNSNFWRIFGYPQMIDRLEGAVDVNRVAAGLQGLEEARRAALTQGGEM